MPTLSKLQKRTALKQAREALGLSQRELGEASDCTTATISDLENGRNHEPSHEKVVHIFQALQAHGMTGITMDELFAVSSISHRITRRRRKAQVGRWTHPR